MADLLGGGGVGGGGGKAAPPSLIALEQQGLRIKFEFEKAPAANLPAVVRMAATNETGVGMEHFVFQAAVTKVRPSFRVAIRSSSK